MKQVILLLLCSAIISAAFSQNDIQLTKHSKIYIVRHAEKLGGDDPLLTSDGNKRAGDLMRRLSDKKISRIYVSEFKRTQNTGDSLRLQLGIDTVQVNADTSCQNLFAAITKNNDWDKHILIITHSNIIQKIIYKLGITSFPQENIPDNEFDNLYKIELKKGIPALKQTKYGKPSAASAQMMH